MTVDFDRDADRPHVGRLRLDFGSLNLLRTSRLETFDDALADVPPAVSVVTIAGAGDGLTAGLDLDWAKDRSPREGRALLSTLYDAIESVRDLDAVTVCCTGAYALGAGFEFAMACDFRVATAEAVLGLPEVTVGLPTVVQGGLLTRYVGLQTAKELIYLGETVTGDRAADLGLVNESAPAEAYPEAVADLVDRLASKSPMVLAQQKRVFREWRSRGLESGMARSVGPGAACFGTEDQREAMGAFLAGRDPEFVDDTGNS